MWISWKATVMIIVTVQLNQALMSGTTTTVNGVEGQTVSFRCEYPAKLRHSVKFLWRVDDSKLKSLIMTNKQDEWVKERNFSLYDNTTGGYIIIRVDKLVQEDAGIYGCGVDVSSLPDHVSVIQLNVVRAKLQENYSHYITKSPTSPMDFTVDSVNKPLFLTAVMCVGAMLFVCLFTLCLLLTVKQRRSGPQHNRQTSADYETMMPSVGTEPEDCCSCPECDGLAALSPPPREVCPVFKLKQRESTVSFANGEYVEVDLIGRQYQHLDLSQLDENVYHSLNGNAAPIEEKAQAAKEQLNC
ncbi:hypothetical protein Q5P01_026333 [Channa striata]|uniref:Ig-like domain-containing protein n=1 Tax=Channa striata TaxID=64152 RepID=A0AA88LG28_CHASR|nr:hypothetical protein Q5P01_026333 [Channa striata]